MTKSKSVAPYFTGHVPDDIRVMRSVFNLTQREMAERLGITPAYLNDIEHGRRRLPDERILACKITAIRGHLISARIAEYKAIIARLEAA